MIQRLLHSDLVRFGIVSAIGLLIDLSVAVMLARLAGAALPVAVAAGFVTGAVANYLMHGVWTFRDAKPRLTAQRGILYLMTLGLVLGTRVGVVVLSSRLGFVGPGTELPVLVVATGISFIVSYVLSKYAVFAATPSHPRSGHRQDG